MSAMSLTAAKTNSKKDPHRKHMIKSISLVADGLLEISGNIVWLIKEFGLKRDYRNAYVMVELGINVHEQQYILVWNSALVYVLHS